MWLNPEATLAEIEPLVANRLLCFRRRFWFSDIDLQQATGQRSTLSIRVNLTPPGAQAHFETPDKKFNF